MNSDKFKRQIESMWKHRDTDEQKRLVKFTIAKTMRLTLEYPELAQEYFDSLCKVIPDNERITVSNCHHNLTSDAEGEEMLTVSRKEIQQLVAANDKLIKKHPGRDSIEAVQAKTVNTILNRLFGSKCLPDEACNVASSDVASSKPKPDEPKCKIGEWVRCLNDGKMYLVKAKVGKHHYALSGVEHDVHEDYLEPYTEPKEPTCSDGCPSHLRNLSQETANCDNEFDNILKDSFSKERRLNIAAMAMQGMLSNTTRFSSYEISDLVRISLNCADALIAESELTDKLKGE